MLRLVVLIISLCAISITSSLASEIEDLELATPSKEALILKKPLLKDVKFPLPLPPLLSKHDDHFVPKFLHSLEKHPLPLRPLGVLKKPIIQEDPKLIDSVHHQHIPLHEPHILTESKSFDDNKYPHPLIPKHKGLLDSLLPEPKLIGQAIHKHSSSVVPKLHQEHFLHLTTKKPILFSKPHLGTHLLNENDEHINILDPLEHKIHHPVHSLPKKPLPLPEILEPKLHDHSLPKKPLLLPEILEPKLHDHHLHLLPKKPLLLPELLEPKLHDHSFPKKPLLLPEVLEPKLHDHHLHLLPKKPLPLPELLEHKIHHHPLNSLPKKPFPLPEPHPGKHLHEEHDKHIHPLDHHIFDGPKIVHEKKLPHLSHLEPHFPEHLVPEIKPKPIGPVFPPPPPLEPKLHHHHSLDLLPKKPLPLPEPQFGIHLQKEHKKPFEPKLVGHVLPPPVILPLEPKLHHDHPLHQIPKKPLLVPKLELEGHLLHNHGHEKHIRPIVPHIFLGPNSINEKKFPLHLDLKPDTPEESVPEIVRPILTKVVSTHVSKPSGSKVHYDHSEASESKRALFVPEPHLSGSLQNQQDKSDNPDLSITRSIPVYETTEEVETIK
ncbi:hypothetical protein WA026_015019 [Henosepilachna vigintioctopunctata]|uniref:Uncharacterized protein n=1 Tax=Henosepilachna vigintioctopunctata TaxID=420089 RepID=A0AAW1U957_9CUCU